MQSAQGGGHRTLLYGHAILLRHSYSGMVSGRLGFTSPMVLPVQLDAEPGNIGSILQPWY